MSVRTGAMVLGIFSWIALLSEIEQVVPLRMLANGLVAVTFLMLVLSDTETGR